MAKYIDAEKLTRAIEDKGLDCSFALKMERLDTLALIDSLQQEQPELPTIERAEYYYHKGVCEGFSQGHADMLKILDEFAKRKADPVIVIKQQELPDVDLEKELEDYARENPTEDAGSYRNLMNIACHFYELGLNARKEE